MSEDTPAKAKGKKPSHTVYHVREGGKDQSFWNRVGSAWAHDDGKGFNVQLHVVPLDGRVVLRVNEPKN
jgi:hypothetical protein